MDIITVHPFNFHGELLRRLHATTEVEMEGNEESPLYCSAYRYTFDVKNPAIEFWTYALEVGDILPELPLFIASEVAVPINLEKTYMEAREGLRVFLD